MMRRENILYTLLLSKESYMITTHKFVLQKLNLEKYHNVMIRARFWVSRRLRLKTRNVHG